MKKCINCAYFGGKCEEIDFKKTECENFMKANRNIIKINKEGEKHDL